VVTGQPPTGRYEVRAGAVPIGSGRDADVYALGNGLVLRRYRAGGDVSAEVAVMRHVAEHGYPVPRVHHAAGPDLVLDRLDGPTMARAAVEGDLSPREFGELLGELHTRLHRIPAPSGQAGRVVVHGDLHPENVILSDDGPMVIDWRNAREGVAAVDVAATAVVLAEVVLLPEYGVVAARVREGLGHFLAAAIDPSPGLEEALARRAMDPALADQDPSILAAAAQLVRSHLRC
jgi:Ser/Thr protein kinase RdoA (MazF antagonist)